jgi:hypothetical protein
MASVIVQVQAMVAMKDNGKRHNPGEVFGMEKSLVPAHVAAKQVRVMQAPAAAAAQGAPGPTTANPALTAPAAGTPAAGHATIVPAARPLPGPRPEPQK